MSKDKNHINHLTPEVIEKYLQDKLTESQRHEVEKLMLDSDFDTEAMEGLEALGPEELKSDFLDLEQNLDQRLAASNKSKFVYWRVAAAISLLAISGFMVFLLLKDSTPKTQISQVKTPERIVVAPETKAEEPQEIKSTEEAPSAEVPSKPSAKSTTEITMEDEPEQFSEELIVKADEEAGKEISEELEIEVKKIQDQIAARSQAVPSRIDMPEKMLTGKVISANDNAPIAGVNVVVKGTTAGTVTDIDGNFKLTIPQGADSLLVASFIGLESQTLDVSGKEEIAVEMYPDVQELSEVVVTRARQSEKKALGYAIQEDDMTNIIARQTVEDYEKYLEDNQQYPSGETKRGKVVVSFFVSPDSTLSDFNIEKSLGEEFDKEALRLIEEGPKWAPALENGQAIRQKVEVEVKFRK